MVNNRRFDPDSSQSEDSSDSRDSSIPLPKPPAWMQPIRDNPAPERLPDPPRPPSWMQPIKENAAPPKAPDPVKPASAPVSTPVPASSPIRPPAPTSPGQPEMPLPDSRAIPQVTSEHLLEESEGEEEEFLEGEFEDEALDVDEEAHEDRFPTVDPALSYVVLVIVTILGLYNMAADVRFTIVWSALTVLGAASIAADQLHVDRPSLRDLLVGVGYGALIGVPMMIIAAPALQRLSFDIFGKPGDAFVFQALAFAMPMGETLFFRGAIQQSRGLVVTFLAASLWSLLLFVPSMNVGAYPLVALVIGLSLCFVNFLYSYLAERVGLFSAWTCQATISLLLLWFPRLFR